MGLLDGEFRASGSADSGNLIDVFMFIHSRRYLSLVILYTPGRLLKCGSTTLMLDTTAHAHILVSVILF